MKVTISEKRIWLFVFIALLFKITYFIYYKWFITGTVFGGGNDADYYNAYAIGADYPAVNFWPIILRFLNEMGFYNRNVITWVAFVISLTLQPYVYYKMVKIQADEIKPVMARIYRVLFRIYYVRLPYKDEVLSENIWKTIEVENTNDDLLPFLLTIPLQKLAYLSALKKGYDTDKHRNLSKSVTVE